MTHQRTKHIVVAFRLAGEPGRRKLGGFLRYIAEHELDWNLQFVRIREEFSSEFVSALPGRNIDGIIYSIPSAKDGAAELAKLNIDWYGGVDLSKMHDLTAASLYAHSDELGADICITHAFCPISMAAEKSDKDHIPLFGWQEDGLLTICNSPTVNYADVVSWFTDMRKKGFNIRQVGHDRKFGREYIGAIDQPQYYYVKSEGFRHIEKAAKDGCFYYLHSQAFEYCVSNVACVEKNDDMVIFYKLQPEHRIDLFDASVFACCRYLENAEKSSKARKWWE